SRSPAITRRGGGLGRRPFLHCGSAPMLFALLALMAGPAPPKPPLPPPASHEGPILDTARLFDRETVKRARQSIAELKDKHKLGLVIETVEFAPEWKQEADRGEQIQAWMRDRAAKAQMGEGLYVLIVDSPRKIHAIAQPDGPDEWPFRDFLLRRLKARVGQK